MLLQVLNNENKTCDGLQIMNQNKMADSDCGLRHHYVLNSLIAKCVPIVFVCVRFVKIYGCQYNQSSLLKIDIFVKLWAPDYVIIIFAILKFGVLYRHMLLLQITIFDFV